MSTQTAAQDGDVVLYESQDGIAVITMNRPQVLNAVDDAMVDAMAAAWARFRDSETDRVAIVTGAGDRAFTAGADLKAPPKELWMMMPGVGVEVDKPIIAAVDGHCIGAGAVLVTACDMAVMTERATISYPEAQVGFTNGGIIGLAARIPHKVAMEFMLCGARFSAQRAYNVGMINKVVPNGAHMDGAMEYARTLADSAPLVTSLIKRFVHETVTPKSPTEWHAWARRDLLVIANSADRHEGTAAFQEKRKPRFTGR